jgi:hypothetical protein
MNMEFTPIEQHQNHKPGLCWLAGSIERWPHVALSWVESVEAGAVEFEQIDMARLRDTPEDFVPSWIKALDIPVHPERSLVDETQNQFLSFDYQNPPADGLYWVAGTRPDYDVGADAQGHPEGHANGQLLTFVSLVSVETDRAQGQGNEVAFFPLDKDHYGYVDEGDFVEYYLPFQPPAHPQSMAVQEVADLSAETVILTVFAIERSASTVTTRLHYALGRTSAEAAQAWFKANPSGVGVADEIYVAKAGAGASTVAPGYPSETFSLAAFEELMFSACPVAWMHYTR